MPHASSSFVIVLFEARAKPGKEAELRSLFTGLVTPSRHESGCIDYEFHEVESQPGTFIAWERWISQEALDAHLQTPPLREAAQRLAELMEGSIVSGIRQLRRLRPAG